MPKHAHYAPGTESIDIEQPGGVDALLAFHRATFGDARMEDAPPKPADPAPTNPPAPETAPPAPQEPKPTPTPVKVAVNEHGFPDKTPVADMAPEHQAAYWRHQSKRHEGRSLKALGFTDEQIDAVIAARKEDPDVVAKKATGYDELAKRVEGLEKSNAEATARAEIAEAVATYKVSAEDAPLLVGLTGDTLVSLAKRLGGEKAPEAPTVDGAGKVGTPVSGPAQIATREEYAALSPEERRAARKDGRLNELLGVKN